MRCLPGMPGTILRGTASAAPAEAGLGLAWALPLATALRRAASDHRARPDAGGAAVAQADGADRGGLRGGAAAPLGGAVSGPGSAAGLARHAVLLEYLPLVTLIFALLIA